MGEIKKQSINNTVLSYIGAALGFLLIYLQPHLIPSQDIGLTRLLYSFGWMTAVIMPFGMGNVVMRFFPKMRNDANGHNGLFGLLLLLTAMGALIVALVLFANRDFFSDFYKNSPDFENYFTEVLVFAYILSQVSVFTILSSSLFKTTITVFLTDVFIRVGTLLLVLVYHYDWIERHTFFMCYMGLFLVQLLILVAYLWRMGAVSFHINWTFFRSLNLRELGVFALIMMGTAFASLAVKFIDQLLIGHYLSQQLLGVYATSVMICAVMEIPFNSLERIAQPKIAYAWNIDDVAEVGKIYEMSSRYMLFIGGVLFCVLWSGIDFLFLFLPEEYQQGKTAFLLVSAASLINLVTGVNSSVILSSRKYFAASFFLFLLLLVSVVASRVLIPKMGISGAALATLLAIGLFNLLKYVYILYRFKMQPFSKHTAYMLLCVLLLLGIQPLLLQLNSPFLQALIGGSLTLISFSLVSLKLNTIPEVNKLLARFGFGGAKPN